MSAVTITGPLAIPASGPYTFSFVASGFEDHGQAVFLVDILTVVLENLTLPLISPGGDFATIGWIGPGTGDPTGSATGTATDFAGTVTIAEMAYWSDEADTAIAGSSTDPSAGAYLAPAQTFDGNFAVDVTFVEQARTNWFGPVIFDQSPVSYEPDVDPVANRLYRHHGPKPRGQNVWLLLDGSVTTVQPAPDLIRRFLPGAHYEPVTDTEAALLTAAGYGGYLQ